MADTDPAAMMAAMAARILKQAGPPPSSAPAFNTTAPRTIPRQTPLTAPAAAAVSAPSNVAPPPTPSFGSIAPPAAEPSPPAAQEQVAQPDAGPSLFGTPEQLAAAREFSTEATPGGRKSRPDSRQRTTSRLSSNISDSPRASYQRSSYTLGGAPAPSASSRLTPPAPFAARPAPSLAASGSSLASNGVLTPLSKPQDKPSITFGKPSTFGSTDQSSSAAAFSFTDIASPKVGEAVETKPAAPATSKPNGFAATNSAAPQHLRAKDWQTFTVDKQTGAGTTKDVTVKDNEIKKEEPIRPPIPTVKIEPADLIEPIQKVKQESEESDYIVVPKAPAVTVEKIKAAPPATPAQDQSVTASATDFARMMAEVAALTKEVAVLKQRVGSLEGENFQLQGKVESMYQMEECRRYLGTNDAKAPFKLSVKCPPGMYVKVQASAMLKISDLIRRVRVASKTPPADSPAPRLAVDGQELGHALTLHEAGITSNSSVEFMHEGLPTDEDEEL